MVDESALLDLKHLLMEAQQRVPPVLMALEDPAGEMDEVRQATRPERSSVPYDYVLLYLHGQGYTWHLVAFTRRILYECVC